MNNGEDITIRVWDRATRLFHWTLVGLIIGLFLTGKIGGFDIQASSMNLFITNMDLHMAFGTCVLVLLVFRLLWGITGSSTAQFKNFVQGPRAVFEYIRTLLTGRLPRFVGHNPAGALMVLALLGGLFLQASSGLFSNDDLFFEGPLFPYVSKETSDTLTAPSTTAFLIFLVSSLRPHIAAALFYRIRGENLITPMITGHKLAAEMPDGQTAPLPWHHKAGRFCALSAPRSSFGEDCPLSRLEET